MKRAYLDWNATTPLRPEARQAMADAMDISGNPSSVHAEGRAAKMALEKARETVATTMGAEGADVIFTSCATESAALLLEGREYAAARVEHDAILAWCDPALAVDAEGRVTVDDPGRSTLQIANSETGVLQTLPEGLAVSDLTQGFGKIPLAFNWLGIGAGLVSAHKLGGPKGIGAVVLRKGTELAARLRGGGQEQGRRAGTENLIGIMGFAAAAAAAQRDLETGVWDRIRELRDRLQADLGGAAEGVMFPGAGSERLPNTLAIVTPGWKGETQVMQMDLAGFAVSAGSACSSGKVHASGTLQAMGVSPDMASNAIRVSLGPVTTDDDIARFTDAWLAAHRRWRQRAA
ncbi:cysteine desulfurase family protein [Paracoccus pacificus]|uniref:Cysteine desulfurase n=1 Tax=Paracoccus pacificus TaxID=1463598 RepID=A0ABW4R5B8_9RHOB